MQIADSTSDSEATKIFVAKKKERKKKHLEEVLFGFFFGVESRFQQQKAIEKKLKEIAATPRPAKFVMMSFLVEYFLFYYWST